MTSDQGLPKSFARFAAIAVVAVGASACSSVPHWADPTAWMGGDDQVAADDGNPDAQTPDLGSIPNKPVAPSTPDERKQVSDTLAADRASAEYSTDALRGGTEASAAPPPDVAPQSELVSPSSQSATDDNTAQQAPPTASPVPATPSQSADMASQQQTASTAPAPEVTAPTPQAASAESAAANTSAAPVQEPAGADSAGFQPSKAPALDPSVARFVPKAVLDRYQQTSTDAAPALTPPVQQKTDANQTSSATDPSAPSADNRSARRVSDAGDASRGRPQAGMATPAAYTPGGQSQPQTVVFFPRDTAALSPSAKTQIRAAAQAFQSRGGDNYVRVVGHSSSRTANMPMARHLDVVFQHSQDFATAVAHELIRDGVPADKVLIEAVGDSHPVYYESMPQGEAGNRRAEIFM